MKTPAQLLADKAAARNMANRIPAMPKQQAQPVQQPVQTAQPTAQQNTLGPNIVKRPITPYSQGGNPIPGSNMVTGQTQQKPIATSTQPVVSLGGVQPKPQQGMEYNASIYDPYKSYSKSDMENWLDLASVKVGQKQQLTEQDQLIGRFMQRRLQELSAPGQLEDPTQKLVEEQRLAQEQARIRLQGQDKQMYDAEQQRINAYYEKRKAETLQSAQRRQDKVQSATSFSGFGRSTFNADQQAQIQQEAEAAISLDQQEMQLAMDRYRRAQEGATAEELSSYDDRITQLQGQSSQFKIAQYEAINEYNQQHASNISSAIDNLFALSSQNQPETPLTDDEIAQAQSYAQLIIGADGKVDTKLLETIPPRLINSAIMQGAQIKGAMKPETDPFEFKTVGDAAFIVDPNTGEFKKVYQEAPKQSFQKVGDQGYSIDPATGKATQVIGPVGEFYSSFRVTQDYGAQSPNTKDRPTLANGQKGTPGIDYAMPVGTSIISTVGGRVSFVGNRGDYGQQVEVTDTQGNKHMFSHLSGANVKVGQQVDVGGNLGLSGNSGRSTGPHLDYRVKGANGKRLDPNEYLNQPAPQSPKVSLEDYAVFNNSTFKPQDIKDEGTRLKYQSFMLEKEKIMSDPDASLLDIMRITRGGSSMNEAPSKQVRQFESVVGSLDSIQSSVGNMKTGPIVGIFRKNRPWDKKAQELNAKLISLIPTLARGVYGEVGVLTDNDVALYQKTIPNLTQTNDVNDAVLAMTLKGVMRGYESLLSSEGRNGKDVSGFSGQYSKIKRKVDDIEKRLGIQQTPQQTPQQPNTRQPQQDKQLERFNSL